MITGSLYPTQYSYPCGFESTDEYNQEVSTEVRNNNYRDMMAGYYLGWARPEKLPLGMRLSRFACVSRPIYELTPENSEFLWLDINALGEPEMNVDIGYSTGAGLGYWKSWSNEQANGDATGNTPTFGGGSDGEAPRYVAGINNLYPEFWGVGSVQLYFKSFYYSPSPDDTYLDGRTFTATYSLAQFDAFLAGALKVTGTSPYGDIQVSGLDFENGMAEVDSTISNKVTVIFTGCQFFGDGMYRGANAGRTSSHINVLTHQKSTFHFGDYRMPMATEAFRNFDFIGYNGNYPPVLFNSIFGSLNRQYPDVGMPSDLQLTAGEVASIAQQQMYKRHQGYVIWRHAGGDMTGCDIWAYYPLEMVHDCLKFLPRATYNINIASYANVNYAPVVTAGNEFTGQWHTGFTSDPGFVATLREWQYIDPVESNPQDNGTKNTNEYDLDDPDDKPEYDPDPPTPEGDIGVNPDNPEINIAGADDTPEENDYSPIVGRPLPFAASEFTTTYVLSESEVKEVGRYLWATMATDPDLVLGNFIHSYDDTGTFNLARMYDMIISLRYFPFDIPFDYILRADGLTMGTGHSKIINRSVAITKVLSMTVDCGTCNIPIIFNKLSPDLEHGDFRNFVNTTITVYLPFCGTVELNPSDVIGYRISLKYSIDLMSGGCTACIYLHRKGAEFMIANKSGNIGILMPITATNAGQVSGTMLSDAANMVATVGSTIMNIVAAKGQMGDISTARSSPDISADRSAQLATQERNVKTGLGKQAFGAVSTSMHGLGNLLSRSGCAYSAMGGGYGAASYTMTVNPFVTIRVSNYASPNNYGHSTGYNSTDYKAIGEFKGFSVFVNPDLTGVEGTSAELGELKAILEHGIFIKK
jgi:hypothetical protein